MKDKHFRDFRFWCQKVLPLVYDDSLSYYEVLAKVVYKLNELAEETELVSQDLINLKEYVDNYFESADFETYVTEAINALIEDGTIGNLINQELLGNIETEIGALQSDVTVLKKQNAVPNRTITFQTLGYMHYTSKMATGNQHCGAICGVGTTQYVISSPRSVNTSNYGLFRKISITADADYTDSIKQATVGHANSICYYGQGKLLVAPVFDYSSGTEQSNPYLYVIDTEGNNLYTINVPSSMIAVSYDWVTNTTYCFSYSGNVFTIENDTLNFLKTWDYDDAFNQDVAVWNGVLYNSSPNGAIRVIDLATSELLGTYVVDMTSSNGMFYLGELDGMEFTSDGHLICVTDGRIDDYSSVAFVGELYVGVTEDYGFEVFKTHHNYNIANRTVTINPASQRLSFSTAACKTTDVLLCMSMEMNVGVLQFVGDLDLDNLILPNDISRIVINSGKTLTLSSIRVVGPNLNLSGSGSLALSNSINVTDAGIHITLNDSAKLSFNSSKSIIAYVGIGAMVSSSANCTITNATLGGTTIEAGKVYILTADGAVEIGA